MTGYKFIDPAYVEAGQEQIAAEFDRILGETLPDFAAEISEGYAWSAPLPAADDFQTAADDLAEHLSAEYSE